MTLIEMPVQVSTHALLKAVEQLPTTELDEFLKEAQKIRSRRHIGLVDLADIPTLPSEKLQRLRILSEKLEAENITDEERTELLDLSEEAELADAKRAEMLVSVAKEREIPLRHIYAELKLADEIA